MGHFDWIKFGYRMPDGFGGPVYQSKDLNCSLDDYEITPAGALKRVHSGEGDAPTGDVQLTGELHIYAGEGRAHHAYDLVFKAGKLVSIRCHQSDAELLFET